MRMKLPWLWRPRLLPLTIAAIALLLGQQCSQLAGAAIAGFPTQAAQAQTAAAPAIPPVVNWDSTQPPPAVCPPETTINPGEIAVLSALRQRAAALDARAAALDRKQALIDASERSLTVQIAGLQAVEDRLNAFSENQTQANEARWQALVATYEAMDPQAAAGIFNGLDQNVLLPVLTRMNSRKSAPILADMDPDKARQATELMAGQTADITLGTALPPATGQ
jgi:flagellar motility protein MotE (MotC chaperone)